MPLLRKKEQARSRVFATTKHPPTYAALRTGRYLGTIFCRRIRTGWKRSLKVPRFSQPRQATSCITILLQFPEQKLRDTFHHDVTGTKLSFPVSLAFRFREPSRPFFLYSWLLRSSSLQTPHIPAKTREEREREGEERVREQSGGDK